MGENSRRRERSEREGELPQCVQPDAGWTLAELVVVRVVTCSMDLGVGVGAFGCFVNI